MTEPSLEALYLKVGDRVRFRDTRRWNEGLVEGVGRDGSVMLRDRHRAARSIAPDRLEVKVKTRRGSSAWQPVVERAQGQRQLFET